MPKPTRPAPISELPARVGVPSDSTAMPIAAIVTVARTALRIGKPSFARFMKRDAETRPTADGKLKALPEDHGAPPIRDLLVTHRA